MSKNLLCLYKLFFLQIMLVPNSGTCPVIAQLSSGCGDKTRVTKETSNDIKDRYIKGWGDGGPENPDDPDLIKQIEQDLLRLVENDRITLYAKKVMTPRELKKYTSSSPLYRGDYVLISMVMVYDSGTESECPTVRTNIVSPAFAACSPTEISLTREESIRWAKKYVSRDHDDLHRFFEHQEGEHIEISVENGVAFFSEWFGSKKK